MKVSIVILSYNYGRYLREALESAFKQTYMDFEVIVVDNASIDDTGEIATSYPVNYVRLTENRRAAGGRNVGVRLARGEWIGYLDADDIWKPKYLEKTVAAIDDGIGIVRTPWEVFGDKESIFKLESDTSLEKFFETNPVGYGALFKKRAWKEVGGFNEDPECLLEDWDFWLRVVAEGYEVATVDEPLWKHREHAQSVTHSREDIYKKGKEYINKKYKHLCL